MIRDIPLHNWLYGEALNAGSAIAVRLRPVARLLSGFDSQKMGPVRWRHARKSAKFIHSWVEFAGCKKSGDIPALHADVGVLSLDKETIDNIMDDTGGRHAVAYRLGRRAYMIGTAPDKQFFGVDETSPDRYRIAMGIGRNALRATAGVLAPDGRFISPVYAVEAGPRYLRRELPPSDPLV